MSITDVQVQRSQPRVEIVEVTPFQAQEWLTTNVHNRPIRPNDVARYVRDITSARWMFTGEGIKFDWNGVMLDGQNRCLAIIRADIPVTMPVFYDLDPASQMVMDSGRPRKVSDQMVLSDEKNASGLAAVVRRAVMYEAGYIDRRGGYIPSFKEQFDYLLKFPGIRFSAETAGRIRRHLNATPSVIGLAHHLMTMTDAYATQTFSDKVIFKQGMVSGDPVAALIRKLGTGSKLPEVEQLGAFALAWNYTREGKTAGRLQAPRGGWSPENPPRFL